MSKITDEATAIGMRVYRQHMQVAQLSHTVRSMCNRLAMDQAAGNEEATAKLKELARFIKTLPQQQREALLAILRGEEVSGFGEGEAEAESWDTDDEPVRQLGLSDLDNLPMGEREGQHGRDTVRFGRERPKGAFDSMYGEDAKRLDRPTLAITNVDYAKEQEYLRRRRDRLDRLNGLAFDAKAEDDSFTRMFGSRQTGSRKKEEKEDD